MKIIQPTTIKNPKSCLLDQFCPKCYPYEESGFVDGGKAHDGDLVEFKHEKCGHTWREYIDLTPREFRYV